MGTTRAPSLTTFSFGPTTPIGASLPSSIQPRQKSPTARTIRVTLDYTAFPHIIDRIIDFAETPALIRLRATCTTLLKRVDPLLYDHIRLSNRWGGKGVTTASPPFDKLPVLPMACLQLQVPRTRTGEGSTIQIRTAFDKTLRLQHTHTLDLSEMDWEKWKSRPTPSFPALRRVRCVGPCPISVDEVVNYVDLRKRFLVEKLPPLCNHEGTPRRSWIIHVMLDRHWRHILDAPNFLHLVRLCSLGKTDVTLVLHPRNPSSIDTRVSARTTRNLHRVLFPQPTTWVPQGSFAIVGLELCPPQVLGFDVSVGRSEIMAKIKERGQEFHPSITYMTMEEWTTTVDPLVSDIPDHLAKEAAKYRGQPPQRRDS